VEIKIAKENEQINGKEVGFQLHQLACELTRDALSESDLGV
jgi:lipopolysaccharide biosynthesis regulator YciM